MNRSQTYDPNIRGGEQNIVQMIPQTQQQNNVIVYNPNIVSTHSYSMHPNQWTTTQVGNTNSVNYISYTGQAQHIPIRQHIQTTHQQPGQYTQLKVIQHSPMQQETQGIIHVQQQQQHRVTTQNARIIKTGTIIPQKQTQQPQYMHLEIVRQPHLLQPCQQQIQEHIQEEPQHIITDPNQSTHQKSYILHHLSEPMQIEVLAPTSTLQAKKPRKKPKKQIEITAETIIPSNLLENTPNKSKKKSPTKKTPTGKAGSNSKGRTKKRKGESESSKKKRLEMKKLRCEGKSYVSVAKIRQDDKVMRVKIERPAREMGETCRSSFCLRSRQRRCSEIPEEKRQILFHRFWNEMTWEERKIYVINNVKLILPKRPSRYTSKPKKLKIKQEQLESSYEGQEQQANDNDNDDEDDQIGQPQKSRRSFTLNYFLPILNEKYPVCKKMFSNTLAIKEASILRWVKRSSDGMYSDTWIKPEDLIDESKNSKLKKKKQKKINKWNRITDEANDNEQQDEKPINPNQHLEVEILEENQQLQDTIPSEQNSTTIIAQTSTNSTNNETIPEELAIVREYLNNSFEHKFMNKKRKQCKFNFKEFNKKLRLQGKAYVGTSKIRMDDSVCVVQTERPPRKLRETCTSSFCEKSNKRRCQEISEDVRQRIFDRFWLNMTWEQRKIYVVNNVKIMTPLRRYAGKMEESRRGFTLSYSIPIKNEHYPVCKKMFLNTLGLGEHCIQSWVKKSSDGMLTNEILNLERENRKSYVSPKERREILTEFFDSLPKLQPSQDDLLPEVETCIYLEQDFKSMTELYASYVEFVTKRSEETGKNYKPVYIKLFHDEFRNAGLELRKKLENQKTYKKLLEYNKNKSELEKLETKLEAKLNNQKSIKKIYETSEDDADNDDNDNNDSESGKQMRLTRSRKRQKIEKRKYKKIKIESDSDEDEEQQKINDATVEKNINENSDNTNNSNNKNVNISLKTESFDDDYNETETQNENKTVEGENNTKIVEGNDDEVTIIQITENNDEESNVEHDEGSTAGNEGLMVDNEENNEEVVVESSEENDLEDSEDPLA